MKTEQEIIEIIQGRQERAFRDMKESSKLAHNSYGAGADWGMWEMCNYILDDIENS